MKTRVVSVAMFLILGSALTWADTIESVEKAIIEKVAKHEGWQAKTVMKQNIESPMMKMDGDGESTFECTKRDGKWLYRMEAKNRTNMVMQGQEQKQTSNLLTVFDGTNVYTLTESDGQKMAMKMKADETSPIIDKAYFDALRKDHDLKLLPDESVDGKKCWVIEATPKQAPPPGMPAALTSWHDQDTGLNIKAVGKDSTGKTVMTMTTTDIKLNPKLPPERFVFKAPEGVPVVDMTAAGGGVPAPAEATAEKSGDAKPAEPAPAEKGQDTGKGSEEKGKPKLPKLPKLPK